MHVVIIGNGISGATAARFLRKQSDPATTITIISSETKNFFSRTALMYIYMGHMRHKDTEPYSLAFWKKNRIDLEQAHIDQIDFDQKTLITSDKTAIQYDKLILALGSSPNKFGWPGQDLNGVQGLYSFQDLQGMEYHSKGLKRAVIVGGGLIGIEMAEMFHSRHIPVTFLVREPSFWNKVLPEEESAMINRHILEHGIDLRLETELKEILPDKNDKCRAVITNTGEQIDCQFVGLTAGVSPNVKFLKEGPLEIGRGIKVNQNLETNIKDVYAIGDCAEIQNPQPGRRPIEAIWYTGRMMGEVVAHNICNQPIEYNPGIWFNSAKFFDIEYQVYGSVLAAPPENHTSIYWEHSLENKAIRLVFDKNTKEILGFNLMGVRYRHEVCEKWIAEKTSVETVIQNLSLANFDPEFFKEYEADLLAKYNQQTGSQLSLKSQRGLDKVLQFLSRK